MILNLGVSWNKFYGIISNLAKKWRLNKYTEDVIIYMLEFLVDNIFVVFGGKIFQQIVGIPMGINCAPFLADIFLYSYEAEFIQSLLSTWKKKLASQFNFTYRYIDDVLSINNGDFENYLGQMYPADLEIKDTTENNTSPSFLDLLLSIGRDGQPHTSLHANVTISTSISQTFRSWVAIFHLFQHMAFYRTVHTLCQGLLLLWMFYSQSGATFI